MNKESELFEKIGSLSFGDLSEVAVDRLKAILLHDLVHGKWGRKSEYYQVIKDLYSEDNLMDQLFLQGMAMSANTLEDFYDANHFGPLIVPNGIYFGMKAGASGKDLLLALAIGFEFGISLADQLGKQASKKGFRGTPLFGILAANLTASYILKSSKNQVASGLSHAYANAFGIGKSLLAGTDEWRYQAALGSYHAGLAAYLSSKNIKGFISPLGAEGYSQFFTEKKEISLTGDLGSQLCKIGVKRYPVHIYVLSPVDAALNIVDQAEKLRAEEIKGINVYVPPHQILPFNHKTGYYEETNQGVVSIPTNVALTLVNGTYHTELLRDANSKEIVELAKLVTIIPNEDLQDYTAFIEVELQDEIYVGKSDSPKQLYFTTFEKESELLIAEAEKRGESLEYILKLIKEIGQLDENPSVSDLVKAYHHET